MNDMLMIVPTRGRPDSILWFWQDWEATHSSDHCDLMFAIDDDDPHLYSYLSQAVVMRNHPKLRWRVGPRLRLSGTLNAAAVENAPHYRYLGFMGDDHRPRTDGWAKHYSDVLAQGTGMVYGNDLLRGADMPTQVAMTSDIVTTLGWMVPPTLTHLFFEACWVDLAAALGGLTYLPDTIVEHMHPAAGKAENDAGYLDVNSPEMYSSDHAAYDAWCATDRDRDQELLRAL